MFENKVLRKICGPKKDELNEQFTILYNEELCDCYRTPCIVRTVKSFKLQWDSYVARMGRQNFGGKT
jgi:hypothetical protein